MGRHTITILIDGAENDNLLNLDDIREVIAASISQDFGIWYDQHGYEKENALVTAFSVDGRPYDSTTHQLNQYPDYVTPDVIDHLRNGRKISAIKQIRENAYSSGSSVSLAEAKALAESLESR